MHREEPEIKSEANTVTRSLYAKNAVHNRWDENKRPAALRNQTKPRHISVEGFIPPS
jgi:hypothetical protein